MILTEKDKNIRKIVKKYSNLSIDLSDVKGKVKILSVRRYSFHYEVDISFSGDIYSRVNRNPPEWVNSSRFNTFQKKSANRLIRKKLFSKLRNYLCYFNVDISNEVDIKKIICE